MIEDLRRQGINLLAVGSWADPAYWGENRTRLLNRAKIVLNLQRYPGALSASLEYPTGLQAAHVSRVSPSQAGLS